jgi:two-component system OmpR family response regulator
MFQTLTGCSGWYAPDVPRILVVDDEPDVTDLVAAILRPAGFEVETVHGGRAALEQLAAEPYDLVICDLVMPEVDGLAVYREIQKRGESRPLMLFLSGYHDAGGYETFLREARVPTAPKPFDVNDLRRTVKRLLGEL